MKAAEDPTVERVQERLKRVFEELGLTIYQASKVLGENSSKFYNILSGRVNPSYDTIQRLLETYPQIRADYLLRGLEPVLSSPEPEPNGTLLHPEVPFTEVPFVPVKFYAGFIENVTEGMRYGDLDTYRVPGEVPRHYREPVIIEISGSSMSPQLPDGAKVLAVNVDEGDWAYQSGGVYAVMYRDFLVVKRIKSNELLTRQQLTLHSDNPNGGSVTVNAADLRALWKIVRIVEATVE